MLDALELEGIADSVVRDLHLATDWPTPIVTVGKRLLGPGYLERKVPLVGELSRLYTFNGQRRIAVSYKCAAEYVGHRIGHELAHYLTKTEHAACEQVERACDYLSAALILPRSVVVALRRLYADDPSAIAKLLGCTETMAFLRLHEVSGNPGAIVKRDRTVYARGPEWFVEMGAPRVVEMARARRPIPGFSYGRLRDDRSRVTVRGEAI